MLAPAKEHTGLFDPLKAKDFARLAENPALASAYLDVLTYLQDMVVPYWDHPEPSRFNVEDATISAGLLIERAFGERPSLKDHLGENLETAEFIGKQGATISNSGSRSDQEELKRESTSYMKGLLATYNQVRTLPTTGPA